VADDLDPLRVFVFLVAAAVTFVLLLVVANRHSG